MSWNCNGCGAPRGARDKHCAHCGGALPPPHGASAGTAVAVSEGCPACNEPLSEDGLRCAGCGEVVRRHCPANSCKAVILASARFCTRCGGEVDEMLKDRREAQAASFAADLARCDAVLALACSRLQGVAGRRRVTRSVVVALGALISIALLANGHWIVSLIAVIATLGAYGSVGIEEMETLKRVIATAEEERRDIRRQATRLE